MKKFNQLLLQWLLIFSLAGVAYVSHADVQTATQSTPLRVIQSVLATLYAPMKPEDSVENRPVLRGTGRSFGLIFYGVPLFCFIVVGAACMWWKGWKLSDLMFASKRDLADALSSVEKRVDQVNKTIESTRQALSSRIDHVDGTLDDLKKLTTDIKEEVSQLRGDMKTASGKLESLHRALQSLEANVDRINEKQDIILDGVGYLRYNVENGMVASSIKASITSSPRPALMRTTSRELEELPDTIITIDEVPNDSSPGEDPKSNWASISSCFGWKPGSLSLDASIISRTRKCNFVLK